MLVSYYTGAKLVFMPAFDLQRYLALVEKYKVTRSFVVPPIITALLKHPIVDNYDLSSLNVQYICVCIADVFIHRLDDYVRIYVSIFCMKGIKKVLELRNLYIHKYIHAYTDICIHTYIHTYIHGYTYIHTYIYTYIHAQTQLIFQI